MSERRMDRDIHEPPAAWTVALGLLTCLVAVALTGCGGGKSASSTPDPANASGQFRITVGDRSLSGRCDGETVPGQPTFFLEAGQGNAASELHDVDRALAKLGLVCSYDRAGLLNSEAAAESPRPLDDLVGDLHAVLTSGHVPSPYLLVGHSLGGSIVLLYAQKYPKEVAGVVSMNPGPTYHDWLRRLRPIVTRQELVENEIKPLSGDVPQEPVDTRTSDALLKEPFPQDLPYTVMYAEDCGAGTDAYCNKVVAQLEASERALASLSPEGRFVAVKGAGHEIFVTDLSSVVSVVKDVMARSG
jgi:pimeloyl-ACP methyl ester carboxylesterase